MTKQRPMPLAPMGIKSQHDSTNLLELSKNAQRQITPGRGIEGLKQPQTGPALYWRSLRRRSWHAADAVDCCPELGAMVFLRVCTS